MSDETKPPAKHVLFFEIDTEVWARTNGLLKYRFMCGLDDHLAW